MDRSRYKETIRVESWTSYSKKGSGKRTRIRHFGTIKSKLDLTFLSEKAEKVTQEMKHDDQLALEFPFDADFKDLRTVGEYYHGPDQSSADWWIISGLDLPIACYFINWSSLEFDEIDTTIAAIREFSDQTLELSSKWRPMKQQTMQSMESSDR